MIRLLVFLVYAIFIIIATPFLFLYLKFFLKGRQDKQDKFTQGFVRWVFKCVLFICGVSTTVIGLENVPEDTPVLYVGNHRSYFDILISYTYFKHPTGFIAKKEMLRIPLLRTWMRYVHCLFIDRTDTREALKTILEGIANIKKGYSQVIYPEGTRARTDEILPFKEGSLKIAEKTKCPIIPMVQNNTSACFEDHMPFFKKTHTVIEFGKPIIISELAPEDQKFLGAYCRKVTQEIQQKNRSLV